MRITPKSEEEIANSLLLPEAVYDFEVQSAIEKPSKNGNDMIEVKLNIYSEGERVAVITDYLLEAMAFKLRHFCDTTGTLADYNDGNLQADKMVGLSGKVLITIKKDSAGKYPDKNNVKDYIKKTVQPDESLPF
jgi:hypothetical protein